MQPRMMTSQPLSVLQGAIPIMSSGMTNGILNPVGQTGGILNNTAPNFIVSNSSMMGPTSNLMQVIQRRDQEQEQRNTRGKDNMQQPNISWVAQPLSTMGQQPNMFMQQQPTFIMGNQPMAQFCQYPNFGQYPSQPFTLQPQGFMPPQGIGSSFPNAFFSDQMMQPGQSSILQPNFVS
jgi:hypothetical protein